MFAVTADLSPSTWLTSTYRRAPSFVRRTLASIGLWAGVLGRFESMEHVARGSALIGILLKVIWMVEGCSKHIYICSRSPEEYARPIEIREHQEDIERGNAWPRLGTRIVVSCMEGRERSFSIGSGADYLIPIGRNVASDGGWTPP